MPKQQSTTSGKHKARKRFGQNFLTDQKIIDQIVATIAPKRDDNLLEIGEKIVINPNILMVSGMSI